MTDEEKRNLEKANQFFAVECFNQIWTFLDKKEKEAEEIETMIHLAHTSFWHWTKSQTVQPSNLATGYWMLSRVYAVAKQSTQALLYAQKCLEINQKHSLSAFSFGYAHEAFARAFRLNGDHEKMRESIEKGYAYSDQVQEEEDKQYLQNDLKEIQEG